MPRLHALRAQEVGAAMFLDELPGQVLGRQCQDQAFQPDARFRFDDEIAAGRTGPAEFAGRGDGHRRERTVKLVGKDVMALRALLGDKGLNGRGQRRTIAGRSCLHQRNKEITSGHLLRTYPVACTAKRNTSAFPLESFMGRRRPASRAARQSSRSSSSSVITVPELYGCKSGSCEIDYRSRWSRRKRQPPPDR